MTEESATDSADPAKHKPSLDNDEVSVDKDGAVRDKRATATWTKR